MFDCIMPDDDTVHLVKDFFVPGENVELLSNLTWDGYSQEWGNPEKNESVEHHRLTIDKEVFRYGIGSHANSKISYSLNRPYSVFHAVVGLDDESACGDGVHFIVLADGREVYHSERLYSTQKKAIDVDIGGATRLELRIDMGGEKNCDHGDWANAWLEAK